MIDYDLVFFTEPIIKALKLYHRYTVSGLEHIPKNKPAIIVVNHSLATYDIFMLAHSIFTKKGRIVRPLIDRLFEKIPGVYSFTKKLGAVAGYHHLGQQLIQEHQLVLVAPGGMAEALRPHTQKYLTQWDRRKGFVRLSIECQCPIIFAMCPNSDDLYKVYDAKITRWAYQKMRIPMIIARGLGPTLIPRPIKLKHYIAPPIYPPKMSKNNDFYLKQVDDFHRQLTDKAAILIKQALEKQKTSNQ